MTDLYDLAFARNLSGGNAPAPVLIEKTVTANGTYSAEEDSADGYSRVNVNIPPTDYSLAGTLTPNSSGAYIFPQNYDWSKPWEIGLVLQKVASSMNSGGYICGSGNITYGYGTPKFNIEDGSIGLYAPYSTSADKDGLGVYFDAPLVRGKAYWIRGGYEGSATNKIYIEMSEDGRTYTRLGEKVITFVPVYDQNVTFSLGGIYNSAGSLIKPYAEIPLNTVYIKIDGQIAWGRSWS